MNVAWHKHISSIFQGESGSQDVYPYVHDLGEVSFSKGDTCFTLGDLISRSRYTGSGYQDVVGEPDRLHRVAVRSGKGGIAFWFPYSGGSRGTIPDGLRKHVGKHGVRMEGPAGRENQLIFKRDTIVIPVFHYYDGKLLMSVAEDFPNGDRLTEFLKLYLISYVSGMLARYFPSKWMSLIRNDEGGGAQPLLARATEAVENDFIGEFAQQLAEFKGDAPFFGERFGEHASMFGIPWRR